MSSSALISPAEILFVRYKWAVNMYECLTVDLFNLHEPMAFNANGFGFHMVSCKYIPSYAIFHDRVEQFHDAT